MTRLGYKYTIYTEHTPQLTRILDETLSGYTILLGHGRWAFVEELAAIVIYFAPVESTTLMNNLVDRILAECKQDSVYVQSERVVMDEYTNKRGGDLNERTRRDQVVSSRSG